MVVRRIHEHVVAHNWFAVAVDLGIVVAGVFIANQVSDWNAARAEAEQAQSYRERLAEELDFNARQFETQIAYYRQAQAYGRQALASLAGDAPLSDRDFLIAAYQLSQTDATPAKTYIYDEMTANGLVTRLGAPSLQQAASDYYLGLNASNRVVAEEHAYRTLIRAVMPYEVQKRIRDACGDREVRFKERLVGVKVVVPCPVRLDPVAARIAVQTVRATPRLTEEMTRYIASLDEKLDQLGPGVDFSRMLGVELRKASLSRSS
jgi:hypothetical protein